VLGLLFSSDDTYVTLLGNNFICNMLNGTELTVAKGLPDLITITNKWIISNNVMDPACPYLCNPGYEPYYNGLAGCISCAFGWISPGGTSFCTACPPGTYQVGTNNCTVCDIGRYAPGYNHSFCEICPTGTPSINHTECVPCPTNHYSSLGICTKCTNSDEFQEGCLDCGFFYTIDSECKDISIYGIILIAALGVVVLLSIVVGLGIYCFRKRASYASVRS